MQLGWQVEPVDGFLGSEARHSSRGHVTRLLRYGGNGGVMARGHLLVHAGLVEAVFGFIKWHLIGDGRTLGRGRSVAHIGPRAYLLPFGLGGRVIRKLPIVDRVNCVVALAFRYHFCRW